MLPAVKSVRDVALRIIGYTVVLWAMSVAFGLVAGLGVLYLAVALVSGMVFLAWGFRLLRRGTPAVAMGLFRWSITYIVVLFGAMAVDRLIW